MLTPSEQWVTITPTAKASDWEVDVGFLGSGWRCIWGDGCEGILDEPAASLGQGCCSVGAELLDDNEARLIEALGLSLDPERFQFAANAAKEGVLTESSDPPSTRVVDGACIFLNRPGFAGGTGCALHLGAEVDGEPPMDWKPEVCWQLPMKVETMADGRKRLRRWRRHDWGVDANLAWCCTEDASPSAYDDGLAFIERYYDEVAELAGEDVAYQVLQALAVDETGGPRD